MKETVQNNLRGRVDDRQELWRAQERLECPWEGSWIREVIWGKKGGDRDDRIQELELRQRPVGTRCETW